jgi:hypothetical protein
MITEKNTMFKDGHITTNIDKSYLSPIGTLIRNYRLHDASISSFKKALTIQL